MTIMYKSKNSLPFNGEVKSEGEIIFQLKSMNTVIEIVPSILSADFAVLAEEIKMVEQAGCQRLHLDVMESTRKLPPSSSRQEVGDWWLAMLSSVVTWSEILKNYGDRLSLS